jgi:2'-5' RNA ligase
MSYRQNEQPLQRLFASIRPPHDWIRSASLIRHQLEATYGQAVRWLEPESYHITVRFFGSVPLTQAKILKEIWPSLGETLPRAPRFLPAPCGCFPSNDPVRVVWVGARPCRGWEQLLAHIDERTAQLGIQYERNASIPHLTLGRVRSQRSTTNLRDDASRISMVARPFVAHSIDLMLSEPGPLGSVYTRCAFFTCRESSDPLP